MPVTSNIFSPLIKLYDSYAQSGDQEQYIIKHRKQIKIIVDTIYEQIIENIFTTKPRNHTDARRIINSNKHKLSYADDIMVVEALSEILRDYDVLIVKNYIDISDRIAPYFLASLKMLCLNLTLHSTHRFDANAVNLKKILDAI